MRVVLAAVLMLVSATPPLSAQDAPPSPQAPVAQPAAPAAAPEPAAPASEAPAEAPAAPVAEQGAADPAAPAPPAPATTETFSPHPATLPHDLSPWGMFMQADIVVKAVMIGLAIASVLTWTVWLAKSIELVAAKGKARRAIRKLRRADSLADAIRSVDSGWTRRGPVAELVQAARLELRRSSGLTSEGTKERLAIALSRIEARVGRETARGTGLLATIGSTAPFVGLFGTVWGIMNSFIGISKAKTTNLAIVAPGIAEALFATALGLVAAIPAVIMYNMFARGIGSYRATLSDASAEIMQHLSRDLDRAATADAPELQPVATGTAGAQRAEPVGQPRRAPTMLQSAE